MIVVGAFIPQSFGLTLKTEFLDSIFIVLVLFNPVAQITSQVYALEGVRLLGTICDVFGELDKVAAFEVAQVPFLSGQLVLDRFKLV